MMASKAVAAIVCVLVPCSGFVRPVQVGLPSSGSLACYARGKHAPRSRTPLRPCRMLSRNGGGGKGAGTAAGDPRRAGGRLSTGLLTAAGGEGGLGMEGEVGEGGPSGPESLPIARREEIEARDAQGGEVEAKGDGRDDNASDGFSTTNTPVSGSGDGEEGLQGAAGVGATTAAAGGGAGAGAEAVMSGEVEKDAALAGAGSNNSSGAGRRREIPLEEREGFSVLKRVLPEGGAGLVMDLDRLRDLRSDMNKLKRNIRKAVELEDYKAVGEIKKEVAVLRKQDPLCVVSDKLGLAISKDKFKRAGRLRDAKDWLLRESRGSVFDVDRLVCLGNKATNVITTDPEGSDVHRFLEAYEVREITKTGQIQLPVWSPDGRMVAFSVLKAGTGATPIESARILVFREGGGKSLDVTVPRPPFLLMWSPNSQSLTYLSNTEGPEGPTIRLSEILVAAAKSPFKTKTRGLAQGNPLFYAFTKKDSENANMVVHTGSRVYSLDMTTGEEGDISSSAAPLFMAPSTHCVGGEDAVILVEGDDQEGQHLISAMVDSSSQKRLCPTRGFSTFGVSPDGRRVCLMQQDLTTGFYTISVLEGGEGALDPRSTATMEQVEIPLDRVIMAFFFSPDSKKLLCLATKMSKSELAVARSSMRLGFQLKFQWVVFDCETRGVTMLEEFSPRQFFLKMYLPYFDMFAQGFTPWSPDSKSFTYVGADAAFVQEVPDDGLAPLPRQLGPNMEFVSWSFC